MSVLGDIEIRNARVLALVREGNATHAEIAHRLARDWPGLTRGLVIGIVERARARGELPPPDPVTIKARQSDGGKVSQPKAVRARVTRAYLRDERLLAIEAAAVDLARAGNLSNQQIADILGRQFDGVSKGQVSGFVYRARRAGTIPPASVRPGPKGRAPKQPKPVPVKAAPAPFVLPPLPDIPYGAEARERRRLAFEAMTDSRGCKFPIGDLDARDFRFCCAEKPDAEPYCAHHMAVAYVPLTPYQRRHIPAARLG